MNRMIQACLKYPYMVLAATLAVTAVSWFLVKEMPVDVLPELKVPRVVIQTEAGGLTAEEVEQRVSVPIEAAMNGIPGVRDVRSSSSGGLSFVWVDFAWNADIDKARFAVFERLARVKEQLPENTDPEIAPVVSLAGEIMLIALRVEDASASALDVRQLAEFELRNRLLAIPGIGQVVAIGGNLPEMRVSADPRLLMLYGLAFADVLQAVENSRTWASAGYLADVDGAEIPLRQTARADSAEALRKAWLPNQVGKPLKLGDVATVEYAGAPRRGSASFDNKTAVVLSIQKAPGGNTLALTREVDRALDVFEKSRLPKGVSLRREAYRQSDFIDLSIASGKEIVLGAAVIVIAVLGLTLLRVRTVLIVLLSMPFSIAAGILFFPMMGMGVNIMTLGGLAVAVGDIVDSAIIFVEIIWRRLTENAALPEEERKPTGKVVRDACSEVAPSVLFSAAIIVLVFLPLLFLTGIEGQFFKPLALAYVFVFAASVLVAVTVTPVLGWLLFPRRGGKPRTGEKHGKSASDSIVVRVLKGGYLPLLRVCMKYPKTVMVVMICLLVGAVRLTLTFGTSFLPPLHEDTFQVSVSMPPGTSLTETERVTKGVARAIRALHGVKSVTLRTGRAERDQHAEPVSASEMMVRVDIRSDLVSLRAEMEKIARSVPGSSSIIGYPTAHRISAVLSGTSAELTVDIFGDSLALLRDAAKRVKIVMDTIKEVADVRANREILVDTVRIDYRLDRLLQEGLTLKDAGEQVSAALQGKTVGAIVEGARRTDVVVRLPEVEHLRPEDVKGLILKSATGRLVRLDEVAAVRTETASNLVVHENGRRKAVISCNVADGSSVGGLVRVLREKVEPVVHAMGCAVSYGGSYQAQQSAQERLTVMGCVVLLAIVLLLTFSLKGLGKALLVMVNIPLCLLGCVAAVAMTSSVVSVASMVGFITVIGFVIRNGMLLLHRYQELTDGGMAVREAVAAGSGERMVPILMTSLTTIFGLIPIAMAANQPGGEILAPLAIVQLGGLVSSTVLNLLVLPALYVLFYAEKHG